MVPPLNQAILYFCSCTMARSLGVSPKLRFFHTFFLPKRERKYQRKRFRAAARTPRGHRGCSALSALEMERRLQRCYCSSQNEALAPLMWRKTHVFGCSHDIPPKMPEGKRGCSRIASPSHNEGTISNAEVTTCVPQVGADAEHLPPRALPSPPWLNLYFYWLRQ